jgi:hypothetical protein
MTGYYKFWEHTARVGGCQIHDHAQSTAFGISDIEISDSTTSTSVNMHYSYLFVPEFYK